MGLDILAYQKDSKLIKMFEFDEELHQIIFTNNRINKQYKFLYLVNDYYKTDVTYAGDSLKAFIQELNSIREIIPKDKQYKLDHLLHSLSLDGIYKARITGD